MFVFNASQVVKKDAEAGDALKGVGKTVIESYNYLTKLNAKYEITDKIASTISSSIPPSESLDSVKKVLSTIDEFNKENDLVAKGKQVAASAATITDYALEKIEELNKKYDFIGIAKKNAATVVDKIKQSQRESLQS